MKLLVQCLIDWRGRAACHLAWLACLFARITVGWVFCEVLGASLQSASSHREFHRLGHPGRAARLLAPFVPAVEFLGGLFLLAGLGARISAGALGVTRIVAIRSAKWADGDSLEALCGFGEFEYLALFL
jgi:putative oxidoreductase